ncbi:unnamed protein product, partial [Urochloa decumbens]|uniref:Uncharacterized protein n=1 Tax=Urochloa decumbens TaxID=240449 RepID=A0ABC9G6R8_9POAL
MLDKDTKAFKFYLSSIETKDAKHKFQKLYYQCLIYDSFRKAYHHYNFSMKLHCGKHYFCCPLQLTDDGPCFGSDVATWASILSTLKVMGYDERNVAQNSHSTS